VVPPVKPVDGGRGFVGRVINGIRWRIRTGRAVSDAPGRCEPWEICWCLSDLAA
jgi:hypothetical protein